MSPSAFALVLAAAFLHAGWNTLVKSSNDRLISTWSIVMGAALVNLPVLLFVGRASIGDVGWYLAASIVIHVAYNIVLAFAYDHADLAVAYPIARGTAPILIAVAGVVLLGDVISPVGAAGVAAITTGLGLLATGRPIHHVRWAFATGLAIASYSVVDGAGVRAGGDSLRFLATSFALQAVIMTLIVGRTRGFDRLRRAVAAGGPRLVLGGAASAGAYLMVLIAARTEPLGLVSGLRETSVLIGLFLSRRLLGEAVTGRQAVAVALAVAGAVAVALS